MPYSASPSSRFFSNQRLANQRFASQRFANQLRAASAAGALLLALGCSSTPRGATDADLAQAQDRASRGAQLFEQQCASCHGQRGQGLAGGPPILGFRALSEYAQEATSVANPQLSNPGQVQTQRLTQVPGAPARPPFRTAEDLHRYVSTRMPYPPRRSGSLQPDEYWAIVHFMLVAHGVEVPADGVSPSNAASISINPR